jgi:hypothetical protein
LTLQSFCNTIWMACILTGTSIEVLYKYWGENKILILNKDSYYVTKISQLVSLYHYPQKKLGCQFPFINYWIFVKFLGEL